MISQSPIKWTCRHVVGHHDDRIEVLDKWAKLNIEMHNLAKLYLNDKYNQHQMVDIPLTNEFWLVSIRGRKISS